MPGAVAAAVFVVSCPLLKENTEVVLLVTHSCWGDRFKLNAKREEGLRFRSLSPFPCDSDPVHTLAR